MTEINQIMPLACKKCGSAPGVYLKKSGETNVWFVQCPACEAVGVYCEDRDSAVSAWNTENKEQANS